MTSTAINYRRPFTMIFGLALMMSLAFISAQVSIAQTQNDRTMNVRQVPSGAKMKFQGVVIERNGDTFTVRDRTRADYQVLIDDRTSIKTHGGFLRSGKTYAASDSCIRAPHRGSVGGGGAV